MLYKLGHTIYKYYVLTWVFILILFKRQIPKWMQTDTRKLIEVEPFLEKPEKYVK